MLFCLNAFQYSTSQRNSITKQVIINASARKVYRMLTDEFALSKWDFIKAGRYIKLKGEGNEIIFVIADQLEDKCVEWRCLDNKGTIDQTAAFELIEERGTTILNFKRNHWQGQTEECERMVDWELCLQKLKNACEKDMQNSNLKITSIV